MHMLSWIEVTPLLLVFSLFLIHSLMKPRRLSPFRKNWGHVELSSVRSQHRRRSGRIYIRQSGS